MLGEGERKLSKGDGKWVEKVVSIFIMSRESLIEKVTTERRCERSERVGHMTNGGKSVPGNRNSQGEGLGCEHE